MVSAQLPRDLQISEVIRIIDMLSRKAELNVKTKEPKPSSRERGIEVLPIQITADGNFSQIVKFVYYVTAIERIFRVQSLNLQADEDGRSGNKTIKMKLDVASFRFVPDSSERQKEE